MPKYSGTKRELLKDSSLLVHIFCHSSFMYFAVYGRNYAFYPHDLMQKEVVVSKQKLVKRADRRKNERYTFVGKIYPNRRRSSCIFPHWRKQVAKTDFGKQIGKIYSVEWEQTAD